jgi:hypothetical protein
VQADGTSADASDSKLDLQSIGQYRLEDEPLVQGAESSLNRLYREMFGNTNTAKEAIRTLLSGSNGIRICD